MPIARVNDIDIHYRTDGRRDRPCLMFSNSLGTDLRMWQAQAEAFSADFHVIRYDTRGHGRSASPPGPYSLPQLGQDALALLDFLEIERTHFCGLSMGGVIAQWLGIHAPQRIGKLVIANSAARVGTEQGWRERAALARSAGLDGIAAGAAARWFGADFAARQPERVEDMLATLRGGSAEGYAACCDALAGADLRQDIQAIPNPTLIVVGAIDPVTTAVDAALMQGQIRAARTVTLPASHLSSVEAAAAFNQALRQFLNADQT
ncbi:3-oxoadipate enol-lactonase [Janthinobacterium sp.]|uniref:3-oxoadipate enol-lactonase n=1 Tax=Janthinobacterium sp. TaxID=1871054 RepID=UPI00293D70CF|nr:3-oxoadipate enol-lactonase [Janthinobacterium sp.]